MRGVGLVAFTAACGRFGFDAQSRTDDAPADAALDVAPANCVADEFDDGVIDLGLWTLLDPASPFPVNEQSGALEIALSPGATGYNGIQSLDAFAFAGASDVTIELVQPVSQAGFVDCGFGIDDAAGTRYQLGVGGGNVAFTVIPLGGTQDRTLAPYNPTTMRHLRIAYDEAAATIEWQTSADRVTWQPQRTLANIPPVSPATALIFAGAFAVGSAVPGTATWDRFKLSTPACP